jgi:hypothetical protein
VAKPEWGTKRQCETCEAKFYDLGKSPIVCPDCGAEFKVVVAARPAPKPEVKEVKSPPKHDRRKRAPEGQDAGDDDDDEVDDIDDEDDGIDLDEDENDATLDDVVDSGKTE